MLLSKPRWMVGWGWGLQNSLPCSPAESYIVGFIIESFPVVPLSFTSGLYQRVFPVVPLSLKSLV